ncbi:D-alanyl-D-alanine carboxypeptidase/D-alanyl-D-alanine endopeptidase [Pontibacter sp. MBLB2868]|uniref:D-alanyl-D-alanine carboxypeptidase/D-alanyl-D-alanine endopeptidase n=1 Tax=Pontibacter sp. MBLB2868 TaxID=3451555 RepID=UPI003F752F0A
MKNIFPRFILLLFCLLLQFSARCQSVPDKLAAAFKSFEEDAQLANGIASLYVTDAATGKVVFEKNGMVGLAPASTMKVITSASAYELLGKNYTYRTTFAYQQNKRNPYLLIVPAGDPTLGSWRWSATNENTILKGLTSAIEKTGVKAFGEVIVANKGWNFETVPDGWMWQDIANYYGAGASKFNWRENQYDVILKSGKKVGDPVTVVKTIPRMYNYGLRSELTSAAAGTGDNAYIYFPLNAPAATIRGTIPVNENSFRISGAMPSAADQFVYRLSDSLRNMDITLPTTVVKQDNDSWKGGDYTTFYTVTSPPLDSIIYWFNRKSINLYGEALVKTIAFEKEGSGSTEAGLKLIRDYWQKKGIPDTELSMVDGSGLSPLNRITTHAQVRILEHARKQNWYNGFYKAMPLYNGMKMKSGTIHGVKGYSGYHKSKDGKEYVFSFLVNNYSGSSGALVQKMYKVLDVLK